jgi:glycosyltransferase involved in cell wall biosynthesis
MKTSFITWYPSCRRSDALADALGGTSHLIHYFQFKRPAYAPLKYILQSVSTWRCLWRDEPELVLVASPPVFAIIAVWLYCQLFQARYVIDAHTGVFDDKRWTWVLPLSRFLSRKALATIVTNRYLQQQVETWGAKALVIGDVPVEFPATPFEDLGSGSHVAVINTFSQDEPLDEILKAAKKLPEIEFHITGNLSHSRRELTESPPSNVRFTGWLSETDYAALLRTVDVVMCLTTHDHTMQRGAYEAMALGKPLITSDWCLLRETFNDGTIHVNNSADDIGRAITVAIENRSELSIGMGRLAGKRLHVFERNLQLLKDMFVQVEDAA